MSLPPAHQVVGLLGIKRTRGRNRYSPCPACGRETGKDGRGPLVVRDGFRCFGCDASGPTLELVALRIKGTRSEAWRWLRDQGELPDMPDAPERRKEPTRAPEEELRRAFTTGTRADRHPEARAYLEGRGFVTEDAWVVAPGFTAEWWPTTFSRRWPIIVPTFNGHGQLRGLHGIAIDRDMAGRKTTWPKGVDSAGLLFACPAALEWMRGGTPPPVVVLAEGATDFLHAASLREYPVLGIESGSADALRLLKWVDGQVVVEAMDHDPAGDRYRVKIRKAIPDRIPVRSI